MKVVEEPELWDDEGISFQMNIKDFQNNPETLIQEESDLQNEDFMMNYTAKVIIKYFNKK